LKLIASPCVAAESTGTLVADAVYESGTYVSSFSLIICRLLCAGFTGPAQSVVWDALVPSRKRTCFTRPKQSSVEKLTKDLHTILHEQASHFSGLTEEDLLFESEAPTGSVEFGHGSVLIRHPRSVAREEESEASSLSVDNKLHGADEGYATPPSLVLFNDSKSGYNSCSQIEKVKKLNGQTVKLEQAKRYPPRHKMHICSLNYYLNSLFIDFVEVMLQSSSARAFF